MHALIGLGNYLNNKEEEKVKINQVEVAMGQTQMSIQLQGRLTGRATHKWVEWHRRPALLLVTSVTSSLCPFSPAK